MELCSVFGDAVLYPWSEFVEMQYRYVRDIIMRKSKMNEERIKKMEDAMKSSNGKQTVKRVKRQR